MTILYTLTFICDECGQEYMVGGEVPSMPSHWIGAQVMIGNQRGEIPLQEESAPILHFCTQECFCLFASSQEFKERILLSDHDRDDDDEERDEEEGEPQQ